MNNTEVIIYGRDNCGFCKRAILLCKAKGYDYTYLLIGEHVSKEFVAEKVGTDFKTVPQIFVNNEYVGGYDDFCVAAK